MNSKYIWKGAILTGLIVGIFALGFFSILDGLNKSYNWGINPISIRGVSGLLALLILGVGIYIGIQKVKRLQKNSISYKQAVLTGLFISLITGIVTATFTLVYCQYINPNYASYLVAESRKFMIEQRESPEEITEHITGLQKQLTTPSQVIQAFFGQLIGGLLISLIIGLFVRDKKNL